MHYLDEVFFIILNYINEDISDMQSSDVLHNYTPREIAAKSEFEIKIQTAIISTNEM